MKSDFNLYISALTLVLASSQAFAAEAPDAGRTLQETKPSITPPRVSPSIDIEAPAPSEAMPGGDSVLLKSVTFSGNTIYDASVLNKALGDNTGKSYDLAGLKGLANIVTSYYREHGYPFARAIVPAQPMKDGNLRIEIIEGKYGKVTANGDEKLATSAQQFLSQLQSESVIDSKQLERTTLLLDDLPGIKTTPIIRPGQMVGTGDLDVKVDRDSRFGGEVGSDNYGNRYTGRNRARASLHIDSPFMLGDQITVSGLYTEEDMWLGHLGYSLPVGHSGLRANVGYAHTYYELGQEFANLKANGTAKISNLGLTYPIIRSQQTNLSVAANYQYKRLNDQQDVAGTDNSKSSHSLPITLNFDHRDTWAGGGITYGGVSWTHGDLSLDSGLRATDRTTAKTAGSYDKINLDLARLQILPANFTLYGRVSAQWSNENLDSSESFGLGGANGVRAYPSGEGYGDEGWLNQLELRYNTVVKDATLTPYAFYDSGRVRINHSPWDTADNYRSVSGAGLGLRGSYSRVTADASLAWRLYGGDPKSDTKDYSPMAWFNLAYRF